MERALNFARSPLLAGVGFCLVVMLAAANARASEAGRELALMHRVNAALRANSNLNGASCYTTAPGVIVLYGRVFDDKDRKLAESTAFSVRGVRRVVNTLTTKTGRWIEEEARINDTLQLNGFEGVSVRVVGPEAYLSGKVTSEEQERRAIRVVRSVSNLHVVNFMRVVPPSLLSQF